MFDTIQSAKAEAQAVVPHEIEKGSTLTIAIVKDQIMGTSNRQPGRPYYYCPLPSVATLHRFGSIEETIEITGA